MKTDQAILNRVWSQVLLEELTRYGVEHICIAPGSRSTPLTLEADANPNLTLHHHFDERGLGFIALGLAKASNKPVALIVTSGTAVANLLPAVAEAKLTGEKLVLLTADRPQELVGCGANQAIVQPGIFSSHVNAALNLPSPTEPLSLNWLLTSVDDVLHLQQQLGGAVHINCAFPEPLYTSQPIDYPQYYSPLILQWFEQQQSYISRPIEPTQVYSDLDAQLKRVSDKSTVIIIGQMPENQAQPMVELAERLGWPVFCDPQSGVTSPWAHFDLWLQDNKLSALLDGCDCIVQFGSRIVSKRLNGWLKQQVMLGQTEYIYCSPQPQRDNPYHLPQQHWLISYQTLTERWLNIVSRNYQALNSGWAGELLVRLQAVYSYIERAIPQTPLNEISVAQSICLWDSGADLFIGNSLIVRLVDMFGRLNGRNVFTNRGASGIDGLVATAVGVQHYRNKPLVLLLGDTSLLYDLNALALLSKKLLSEKRLPFVVIVSNNDGGAIFDLLPVPEAQKSKLYQMPHGFEFYHTAQQFGLGYATPENQSALIEAVNQHITQGEGGLVIEVKTPSDQASTMIKQVVKGIYAL